MNAEHPSAVPRRTVPLSERRLYLDANATSLVHPAAKAAAFTAFDLKNPSSPHQSGRQARRAVDEARQKVAAALGAQEKEVTFVSGASEANRWLVDALCRLGAAEDRPVRVVTSPFEHPSLLKPLVAGEQTGALDLTVLKVTPQGALILDAPALARADCVAVCSAHNETGLLPDLKALKSAAPGALFCTDAAQYWARVGAPVDFADFISVSAHKGGGLRGVGAWVLRNDARRLDAGWRGGGQEGGRRPGTEALAPLLAFGAVCGLHNDIVKSHKALRPALDALEAKVSAALANVSVIGAQRPRLPNTAALCFHGAPGDALRMATDRRGLDVGFGAACSALAPEPSTALMALGLSPDDARATVRISLSPGQDPAELDEAADRLIALGRALPGAR